MKKQVSTLCASVGCAMILCISSRGMAQPPLPRIPTAGSKPVSQAEYEYEEKWKEANRYYEEGVVQQKKRTMPPPSLRFKRQFLTKFSHTKNLGILTKTLGGSTTRYGRTNLYWHGRNN